MKCWKVLFVVGFYILLLASSASYCDTEPDTTFLVTRSQLTNMRIGPGTQYPIKWHYTKQHTPFKIISSSEKWHKVEDYEGAVGWIHSQLLVRKPYALTQTPPPKNIVAMHKYRYPKSSITCYLEARVIVKLIKCKKDKCKVRSQNHKHGWVERDSLWGINQTKDS